MIDNYFESDDFKESLSRYEKSIRDGDTCYIDSDDFINISDYYVENGNVDAAFQCLTRAMRIHPNIVSVKIAYAGVLVCLFKFEEVRTIIANINERDAYDVLYLRGQLCIAIDDDIDSAEDYFSRWLEYVDEDAEKSEQDDFDSESFNNDSMSRDARFRIMMSYLELCDQRQDEIIRKWVDHYLTLFSPLGYYKADYSVVETCRSLGLFDFLEQILPQILDVNPYMENGWTMLGISQHMNMHDKDAASSLEYALAINPDDSLANITFAHCMLSVNNYEQALKYLLHFRELSGDISEDFYIGKCYFKLNDINNALIFFHTPYLNFMHSPLKKDMVDSCYELAESYFACDDFNSAEDLLHKILDVEPNHHFTLMLKGCIYLSKDDFEQAMDIFTLELDRYNYSISIVLDVASRFLAYDYNQMSIFLLQTIYEISLKNEEYKTFALLAMAYLKEGIIDEALNNLNLLCEHSPDITKYYFAQFIPNTVLPKDYYSFLSDYFRNNLKKSFNNRN